MGPHALSILRTVYLLPRVLLRQSVTKELVSTTVSRLLRAKWLVSMENESLISSVVHPLNFSRTPEVTIHKFIRSFNFARELHC